MVMSGLALRSTAMCFLDWSTHGRTEKKWPEAGPPGTSTRCRAARSQTARLRVAQACLKVLPAEDRSPPHRAVPTLNEELAHHSVLVVSVPDADAGAPLQGVSRVEGPTNDPVGRGTEGSGKEKSRFTTRDLLADWRCSQAVPNFLSTTDVGRLVPAEEDAGSGKRSMVEAEELVPGGGTTTVSSHASFKASAGEE